ncbi:MAG: hypothetical protein WBF93_19230, partial [Pirellulales bacterium]
MNETSVAEAAEAIVGRADVISPAWSTTFVVLLAFVALAVWVASHFVRRRLNLSSWRDLPLLLVRIVIGTVALWLVCSAMCRIGNFELATAWSLWTTSTVAAFCIEMIVAIYNLERQIVTRRMGMILVALRTAMVLLVALMLAQPVLSKRIFENNERIVAVMVDESTSMDITDTAWSDSEKLRLVETLSPELVKRPYQIDKMVTALAPFREKLLAEAESLASLGGGAYTSRAEQYDMRREPLRVLITETAEAVTTQSTQLKKALDDQQFEEQLNDAARTDIEQLHERLVARVENRLLEARQLLEGKTGDKKGDPDAVPSLQPMETHLREAATELWGALGQVPKVAERIDHEFLASLSDEKRQEIEAVVAKSRATIAQALLLGQGESKPGLIDLVAEDYTVRVYLYSSEVAPVEVDEWKKQIAGETDSTVTDRPDAASDEPAQNPREGGPREGGADEALQSDSPDRRRQTTDLAGALTRMRADIPAVKLSGVLVVSDGRDNGPADPDAVVRQLAAEGTRVCTLVIGSSRPPTDAAISSVDLPKSVLTDDRLDVQTVINVAGMKGGKVVVKLLDKTKETTLDEKTVKVASDEMTKTVVLSHTPKEIGLFDFHVVVEPADDGDRKHEVLAENNERKITVAVTDDRTHVLIIEGRPRWEFRYLRNLLADRDKTARLQSVLFTPDQVAEIQRSPPVHASVARSREKGKSEATLPPKDKDEWLKFDVIVLGDVPPGILGNEILTTLSDFVNKRGGTLITIAGPNYMPHAYDNTPLKQLLPINFSAATGPLLQGPEPQFRWGLTAVGRTHPTMKQSTETGQETDFWKSLPPFFWRHEIIGAKPGAAVLAYATTAADEREFDKTEGLDAEGREALLKERKAFESKNALVVAQSYGIGRVLMLNT